MTSERTLPAPPGIHSPGTPDDRYWADGPADGPADGQTLDALAIVVPARNEEQLIGRCLSALAGAVEFAAAAELARLEGTPQRSTAMVTVLVVDSSDDSTEAIARRSGGVQVITTDSRNVGEARRVGIAHALNLLSSPKAGAGPAASDPSRIWIANTDADSAVPPTWLIENLAAAARGADALLGTIRPDLADFTPAQRAIWARDHPLTEAAGHIHGANLGVRASAYLSAGGFSGLAEHEDVDLVARLRALDARIVASANAEVLTSGRLAGRTPGGYAGFLRDALPPR